MPDSEPFSTWLNLRLQLEETALDDDLLEACELQILRQPLTEMMSAVRVATVIKACMEDGGRSDGADVEAMQRLVAFIDAHRCLGDGVVISSGLLNRS